MSFLTFALAYTGLAALSLAMHRHAREVFQRELADGPRLALRCAGGCLLVVSLILTVASSGWPVGTVEWFGMLIASAVACVLLLTYYPKAVAVLAAALPALAVVVLILDRYRAWPSP